MYKEDPLSQYYFDVTDTIKNNSHNYYEQDNSLPLSKVNLFRKQGCESLFQQVTESNISSRFVQKVQKAVNEGFVTFMRELLKTVKFQRFKKFNLGKLLELDLNLYIFQRKTFKITNINVVFQPHFTVVIFK
eukprot:TRINITY_DN149_c1_g2_i1.p2 TRINITY_DN149_c1_g2~~TRINITY_DN149_c1_g2_i1.p2  ORF type:complete len:132 (-),score=2.62 TRINITY_DN149_c1_g2_i1:40-435(-)